MKFDEELEQYVYEFEGLIFAWEDEQEDDCLDTVKSLAKAYREHLDDIIEFMMPDLEEAYGDITLEDVKGKLGRPTINPDNGLVTYYEQSFDDCHIFELEFLDDKFEELQYFSIDG